MCPRKRILIHLCCAPDALYVMGILKNDFEVTGYFYNPNIHPEKEYKLRLEEIYKVARILKIKIITGSYNTKDWKRITSKYQFEPEKGIRCDICYAIRIKSTAQKAQKLNFDGFTTVMSLSPMKKADALNRIGKMFSLRYNVPFLEANFKKKDGFNKSVLLSKKHNLYRQNYCGCCFSQESKRG